MAVAALLLNQSAFWRPYNDEFQESLGSFYAHNLAVANYLGINNNPFVARSIDIVYGAITINHHWPNGFFSALAIALKIFGDSEIVGRSLAIILFSAGAIFIVIAAVDKKFGFFAYFALPLIFLTSMGKDAIPFVFADAALYFFYRRRLFSCGSI